MKVRVRSLPLVVILAVLGAFSAGCSKGFRDKLPGTWAVDMMAMLEGQKMDEQQKKMMEMMFANASIQITFKPDGAFSAKTNMMGQEQEDSGTWSVLSSEGNTLTVTTTSQEGEKTETLTMTFRRVKF